MITYGNHDRPVASMEFEIATILRYEASKVSISSQGREFRVDHVLLHPSISRLPG